MGRKTRIESSKERVLVNASMGMEYNDVCTVKNVSKLWHKVDVARSPNIQKGLFSAPNIDVQSRVYWANEESFAVNTRYLRFYGRRF